MKTSAVFVVLALSAIVTTRSHANCQPELVRYAQSLHTTANELVGEYRSELKHRHVCSDEREFLESLCSLENLSDRFLDLAREGEDQVCLQRSFCGLQRGFDRVQRLSTQVRTCDCVRSLVCKMDRTLEAVDSKGLLVSREDFRYEDRHVDYDRRERPVAIHNEDDRRTIVRPEAALIQGLLQLLQRR